MAVGVVGGAMLGRYLAHEAPLFGGLNMMAEPGSPARQALVPGHVALLGTVGGLVGLVLGVGREMLAPKKSKTNRRKQPTEFEFPD